jgi:hypothetical protein
LEEAKMSEWSLVRFSEHSPKVHVREGRLSVCGGSKKATPVDAGTVEIGKLDAVTCGICKAKLAKRFSETATWTYTPLEPKPAKPKPEGLSAGQVRANDEAGTPGATPKSKRAKRPVPTPPATS